jgi:tRNA (mo5U34)-methyltransferase
VSSQELDLLSPYQHDLDWTRIKAERENYATKIQHSLREVYLPAVTRCESLRAKTVLLDQETITIGDPNEVNSSQSAALFQALRALMPWKKGPFSIFGHGIDTEWRSDWKWTRITPFRKRLTGKRVADIGCHNGYFMFRMAAEQPRIVVGFEPVAKHHDTFNWLNSMAGVPNLHFEPLGVESIDAFPGFFDSVFCLGILYHHPDPIGILRKIHLAMDTGAELIVDCQGIPGPDPTAWVPTGRYAGARGVWFLPTQSCLETWIHRAGFREISTFFGEPLTTDEQRPTDWARVKSLADYLDVDRPGYTVEGYPAPWRFYTRAVK